jgi:cell division protein FtsI/penicillin-binding protein 2/cell division protein FtsW (lipid II flippase)
VLTVEWGLPRRRRRPVAWRLTRSHSRADVLAVLAVAVLVGLGLAHLVALDGRSLAEHQAVAVAVGLGLVLLLRRLHAHQLRRLGWVVYLAAVLLLLAVAAVGATAYGARRWLGLGSVTFQPSELAKIGLLLALARVLAAEARWYSRLFRALLLAAVPVTLVALEPDLSTATVLTGLTAVMLVLGRIPLRVLIPVAVAIGAAAPMAEHLLHPYQLARLHAFLDGSRDASGPGWTILQAHIALAWGGTTGQARQQGHLLLAQYLPERESDLAFASLVEEWGIVAGIVAVLAAAVLVWRLAAAARQARTPAAQLAAGGFAALVGIEVAVSVAANLGLLPTAGVPFPLLSYGGTAAAAHIAAVGLVLGLRAEGQTHELWVAPRWRRSRPRLVRATATLVSLALLGMAGFAWHLQRTQGGALRTAGLTQMTRCIRIPAPRGIITDRHGTPLALNTPADRVWFVPSLVEGAQRNRLAALLGRPRVDLDRLAAAAGWIVADAGSVPVAVGERLTAAHLRGVIVVADPKRNYPYGALLGPVLGWVGVATPDDMKRWPDLPLGAVVGRAGLEQQYDPLLRGVDGRQCVYVDPAGVPRAMGPYTPPVPGATLRLTIDLGLQEQLTHGLVAALHAGSAPADLGGAVIVDPRDGQVLAMASAPSYDDNVYTPPVSDTKLAALAKQPGDPMLEHVTQAAAPPGSTFKLVVAAADMVHPVLPPDEVIPTGASWTLDGHVFHNWSDLPPQDLRQAIAWSNDVYFYQLAYQLGPDRVAATAQQFGVGRPTGVDLPGEAAGYLGTPETVGKIGATWYPGSSALLGIGQGFISVTPMQDAVWTAGVATGRVITPHLGMGFTTGTSPLTMLSMPAPRTLPFASKLGPVRDGMRQVVTNGTALMLQNLPVPAGGKTGTAEDPSAPGAATDSWLSAVAPFDPARGLQPVVAATAFVHGGDGHATSTDIVDAALRYFFAHEKAILGTS